MTKNALFREILKREGGKHQLSVADLREVYRHHSQIIAEEAHAKGLLPESTEAIGVLLNEAEPKFIKLSRKNKR